MSKAQVDTVETDDYYSVGPIADSTATTWHHSPIHRQITSLQVQTDEGKTRGILLVATDSLLVIWTNPNQMPNLLQLKGNAAVFYPKDIIRMKTYFENLYVYTAGGAAIGGLITGGLGVASSEFEGEELGLDAVILCCIPIGCATGAFIGASMAFIKSRPHLSSWTGKSEDRYKQSLLKLIPHALFLDRMPTEISNYVREQGF